MRVHNLVDEVVPIVKQLTLFFFTHSLFLQNAKQFFSWFKLKKQKNCVTLLTRWGAAICTLCSIPFGSLNLNVKVCKKKANENNGRMAKQLHRLDDDGVFISTRHDFSTLSNSP